MKPENEVVEIHQMRGFISRTLEGALQESLAMSRATRCKAHLYSLSLSPPKSATVSNEEFEKAIDRAEKSLNLVGQPRVIVMHEKRGDDGVLRRHAHVVWSRIDALQLKAVKMSYDRKILRDVSRDLFVQHGWEMPDGLKNRMDRDIRNFTHAEWQQAKRAGKDPKFVKSVFQDAWAASDSKTALSNALLENGFILAQGKRGHVAVDYQGEVYPVSRWTGLKAKQVRERLGSHEELPSVQKAHAVAAKIVTDRLKQIRDDERQSAKDKLSAARERKHQQEIDYRAKLKALRATQNTRRQEDHEKRIARVRKGLLGFLDRLTGKRKRILEQNKIEIQQAKERDLKDRQTLRVKEAKKIRHHVDEVRQDIKMQRQTVRALNKDIAWLNVPDEVKKAMEQSQKDRDDHEHQINRSRDGPELEM
jgi:hypothetical protein